jgi:ORF6N domain-containing protein
MSELAPPPRIENAILILRRQKVLLDADPAALYAVETKLLVKTFKRNSERSPADFMFQLLPDEVARFEVPNWNLKTRCRKTMSCPLRGR